jgi:hypothetical protein
MSGTKEENMKRTSIQRLVSFSVLSLGLLLMSCNAAPDGFNAPLNSTVSVPDSVDIKMSGPEVRIITDVSVAGPIGVSGGVGPLNDIFVTATCFNCMIYDWPAGTDHVDASLAELQGSSYTFTTDRRGRYTLVVWVDNPQSGPLGVSSYEATFTASIGVDSSEMKINVGIVE